MEGVFVKTEEKWVLDWEQFVRYSSESWTLFHQRIGTSSKGIFRVYVEEIASGEGASFKPWIKIQIFPPFREQNRREREASEVLVLDENNPLTDKIIRVFSDKSSRSKGFSEVWKRDPRGLRRVTLELEWVEDTVLGGDKMVVKDVLADHWRGLGEDVPSQ